jgi:iron complex outermembrane receptor protein
MRLIRDCGVLLATVVLIAPVSIAQTSAEDDLAKLNLEQLMKVQFSTASKHAEDVSATPASVSVITRADIRAHGYRTLAEVLQSVRGFWVNSDRNYSYLGVRGFARPGDYNTRVLLLVNGHRLNDNIFYQALIGTEFPLDLDLIERIEIVRGPASSLYGTNAFFGVVNVITQQPSIAPTVETSVEAGSGFTRKARVTIGFPGIFDGALFSASMYRSDGSERLYFPEFDTPMTNHGIAYRMDGDRYESGFALVRRKNWTFEGLLGSREKLIPTASFDTIFNDGSNRTIDTRGFVEARYHRDFLSGLQLTSRWFYDVYSYRGTYTYLEGGSRVLNLDSARGDWVGTELNVSRPLGARNRVTTGFDFRYNLRQNQRNRWESSTVPLLDDNRNSTVFAFYAQDELKLTARLSVNGGLRVDHYSTFGTAVSPRAAAIFRPDSKTVLKYAYGHAFRAPNSYELYYSYSGSQQANPGLQPETIDSHNISVERALTPNVRAVAEVFYSRLDSLLDVRVDPVTGISQYVNVNLVTGKGLEFEIDVRHGGWRGELSYVLQRSHDQSGTELANLPRNVAKLKLQAPLHRYLIAGADLQYASPQFTYLNVRVPDSLRANLTLATRIPVRGFSLSASCYNLLDRRNYDPVSPGLRQLRLLEDGREFRIKITWTSSRH